MSVVLLMSAYGRVAIDLSLKQQNIVSYRYLLFFHGRYSETYFFTYGPMKTNAKMCQEPIFAKNHATSSDRIIANSTPGQKIYEVKYVFPLWYISLNQAVVQFLKGQCHEIFCYWFFSWISFPQAPEYTIRTVSNFSLMLLIPVANLPPVSTIPAANLPPVSTTISKGVPTKLLKFF